jgi:hypothetical protein
MAVIFLFIGGLYNLAFAVFHVFFARIMNYPATSGGRRSDKTQMPIAASSVEPNPSGRRQKYAVFSGIRAILAKLLALPRFKWKSSLRLTTPVNRAVMQVMNLCLIFLFIAFSGISFFGREILLNQTAGKLILTFIAGFWFWRALLQLVFFGGQKPVSLLLVMIFLAGSVLYGLLASGFLLS